MTKTLLLLLLALVTYGLYPSSDIKTKKIEQKYFMHDVKKGAAQLEQNTGSSIKVYLNSENSTPVFVEGPLTKQGYVTAAKDYEGKRFLSENAQLFGLKDAINELKVNSSASDEFNKTHIKYDQMVNGVRIFPSQIIVHINSNGSVEAVNGNYIPTPVLNTTPKITEQSALSTAENFLRSYKSDNPKTELIVMRKRLNLLLAYEVKLPTEHFPNMKVYVNAADGTVIEKDDGLRYDGPAVGTGVGLKGTTKSINTFLSEGKYYLVDATLPMFLAPIDSMWGIIATYDAKNDTNNNGYDAATLVSDPNGDNVFNDNNSLKAAVDAHFFTQKVYKFYLSHYGRNSFDDKGTSLLNVVHYMQNYQNAFWNGIAMTYGDGDGTDVYDFASGLDVIAHEITHGVTDYTSQLVYHLQPGAMNEHISDVFGCLVDSTNWLIGEDVVTKNIAGDALRNMQDPHNNSVKGSYQWQPAHMDEFVDLPDNEDNDWGGVHINSGILNKAFYNVASQTGHFKAGKIWYRAITTYLTSNAQFTELRTACLNAAKDLFGQSSAEYTIVGNAFDDVGITSNGTVNEITYDDNSPDSYVYLNSAGGRLATKFTAPLGTNEVQNVKVYIAGDANNGSGHFTLEMFLANNSGMPGAALITPYSYTPSIVGWQSFSVSNLTVKKDFFISALYDGTNYAGIGADGPPGLSRSYIYDPSTTSWYSLSGTNDYIMFMRATLKNITSVTEIDNKVPDKFELSPNYPNPFNPSTTIRYSLPEESYVQIKIFDVNGNHIADLADNLLNPGTYTITWNGKNNNGVSVASGIYYMNFRAGNFVKTTKMMLLK